MKRITLEERYEHQGRKDKLDLPTMTPWTVATVNGKLCPTIWSGNQQTRIAECKSGLMSVDGNRANAMKIVLAVNHIDPLVEILRDLCEAEGVKSMTQFEVDELYRKANYLVMQYLNDRAAGWKKLSA